MLPLQGTRAHSIVWRVWKRCESYASQSPKLNLTEHLWEILISIYVSYLDVGFVSPIKISGTSGKSVEQASGADFSCCCHNIWLIYEAQKAFGLCFTKKCCRQTTLNKVPEWYNKKPLTLLNINLFNLFQQAWHFSGNEPIFVMTKHNWNI